MSMVLFHLILAPKADASTIFSQETLRDTQAQLMTIAEARKVGFNGIPDPPEGHEVRLVAVAKRDERRIHNVLESSPAVANFQMYDID
jgi:hypothetical protein